MSSVESVGTTTETAELLAAFLAARPAPADGPPAVHSGLAELLAAAWVAGRTAWPGLALPPAAFARHLAAHVAPGEDPAAAVAAIRADDLFLAAACAEAVPGAAAALDRTFFTDLRADLARRRSTLDLDDVLQSLRAKLLVGPPPALAAYSGRGRLRNWLRVVAVRLLLNLATRGPQDRPGPRELSEETPVLGPDPELEQLKQLYREEFRAAFHAALPRLEPAERNLLRQAVVEELGIDALAELLGVHRATAARRLAAARERLGALVREELGVRLQVAGHDLESILRLVRSRIQVTLDEL
jgi:RNA polymerase sigma-70 factor (ECF subfamily)